MPSGQILRRAPVLKVLVVRLDLELRWESFKVLTPGLQRTDDREHLFVVDFVVPFRV